MTTLLTAIALALTLALPVKAAGFTDCPQFFFGGKPPTIQAAKPGLQRELCFDGFAVLHSGESKTPVYVAEYLSAEQLNQERVERTNRFYEEARLPRAERATLEDYKQIDRQGRKLDKGHLAPAGDMRSEEAMAQSFSLANMVPQAQKANRGVWARSVEKPVRQYVQRAGQAYVLTGPVYTRNVDTVGKVWVPQHLFKLVHDPVNNKTWAYWVDNADDARMRQPITYDELVARTGIEFLPALKAGQSAARGKIRPMSRAP